MGAKPFRPRAVQRYGNVTRSRASISRSPKARSWATSALTGRARRPRFACCSADSADGRTRGDLRLDCQHQVVKVHRHLAYVPGETSLWPSLTGTETLHLLGRVQGRVDEAYTQELIRRFDLDVSKKVRAYSKGNRQKLILVAALMTRPDLLVLDEPTSGLDPLMEQAFVTASTRRASEVRRSSCPRTS